MYDIQNLDTEFKRSRVIIKAKEFDKYLLFDRNPRKYTEKDLLSIKENYERQAILNFKNSYKIFESFLKVVEENLEKYNDMYMNPGFYEFIKGGFDFKKDKNLVDTALREVKEESGLILNSNDYNISGILDNNIKNKFIKTDFVDYLLRSNGNLEYIKTFYLEIPHIPEEKIKLSKEHRGVKWCTMDQVIEKLACQNMIGLTKDIEAFEYFLKVYKDVNISTKLKNIPKTYILPNNIKNLNFGDREIKVPEGTNRILRTIMNFPEKNEVIYQIKFMQVKSNSPLDFNATDKGVYTFNGNEIGKLEMFLNKLNVL